MKILMVCLGNICRSPMAEGILKAHCRAHHLNWTVHSAGTEDYHVGHGADRRAVSTAHRNGIDLSAHCARQFSAADFKQYDIIYAMATDVLLEIKSRARNAADLQHVRLFMDELFPGASRSVPDPWYGDEAGFQPVYELINSVCEAIIAKHNVKK